MDLWHRVGQRALRHLECGWGKVTRKHSLVLLIFGADHRVRGMIGFSAQENPIWYPGVPVSATRRLLVFRSGFSEHPPPWAEVERNLFEESYYFDPWGGVETVLSHQPDVPPVSGGINLARARLHSRRIVDVFFEPSLHRVRTLAIQESWFHTHHAEVLSLPHLPEVIVPLHSQHPVSPGLRPPAEGRGGRLWRLLQALAGESIAGDIAEIRTEDQAHPHPADDAEHRGQRPAGAAKKWGGEPEHAGA